MANKKLPPKKLSKADLEKQSKELDSLAEEESGVPAVVHVVHVKSKKKFIVNREYYLKHQGTIEPDEEYYGKKGLDEDDD